MLSCFWGQGGNIVFTSEANAKVTKHQWLHEAGSKSTHSLTHSLPALQHWKASSHNLLQEKIRPFCIVSSLHSLYRVILCFITQPHLDSGVREMAWHRKLKVIMVCRDSSSDSLYYYHLLELFQQNYMILKNVWLVLWYKTSKKFFFQFWQLKTSQTTVASSCFTL